MFSDTDFYLLFTIILLILLLLYYLYKTNLTRQIKKYLQNSGISTKTEILGYYKYNTNSSDFSDATYSLPNYLAILKFYDKNGIEHIILDTFNKTSL